MGTHKAVIPSFTQERFWFLDQLAAGNAADVLLQSYVLDGVLDPAALASALRDVVWRHDVLRTRYAPDGLQMIIESGGAVTLDGHDVSALPDPVESAHRLVADAAHTPFDLVEGPLLRARMVRTGDTRHLLVITAHRSVLDEPSFEIIERELAAAYEHALTGHAGRPAPRASSYHDLGRWQRERAEGPDNGTGYWRHQLAGAPAVLELPTDRPRPASPSYRAGQVIVDLPATTLAERDYLAAFAALLGKYSSVDEAVIGVTTSGRSRPGTAGLVGPCAGHLPIRIGLSGDPGAADLAERVGRTLREARSHQDIPVERIAVELNRDHDVNRHPVFQTCFDHVNEAAEIPLGEARMRRVPPPVVWTRMDLELQVVESDTGARGRFVYAEDLFEARTVERLARHYATLLEAFATDPTSRASDVDILRAEERRLMLEDWNPVDAGLPSDRTVSELFEEQVRRTPDAVAVVFGDQSLTYAELNEHANRLAGYLADNGVAPEVIVGLCVRRGLPLMVGVLAILKAGGAYLPLDAGNPVARNELLLTDAGARTVLVEAETVGRLPAMPGTRFIALDDIAGQVGRYPDVNLPQRAGPDSMIYVIYTSGSTGRPKGVVMTHRPLTNLLGWQLARSRVSGPTLQFSSIGFDISFQEMFSTWLSGGRLVLLGEDDRRDAERMFAVMRQTGVRRLFCPPMVLDQLAHAATGDLPPLAEIITAGEALHVSPEVRGLLDRLGDVVLDNQYGPSEAHVITGHRMTRTDGGWPRFPPIGSVVTNARIYLLDRHQRLVPIGGVGEMFVGGVCLAREYLCRPELTGERFLPDPYDRRPGARMYRTGDLARWRPDGTLVFLGRVDHQVKIRGYRVEPGEIEAAMAAHPSIAEATVVPVQRDGDRRLAAYFVPAGRTPAPAELRDHLKRMLPPYMVPMYFVPMARIPLTSSGKLDRAALPDPASPTTADPDAAERVPLTGPEEALARIWCDVIGLDWIGPGEDFFEVGGHSLLAARAAARIREEMAVDVPVRMIFEHCTVARLAAAIADGTGPAGPPLLPVVGRRPDLRHATPAPIQRGVWLLHQIDPGCAAYNIAMCFELTGPLDTVALDQAMTLLVARHETLRTGFTVRDEEPIQVITDPVPGEIEVVDLCGREDDFEDLLAEEIRGPFDLTRPPLWRAVRYVFEEDRQFLALVMHHLVTDGLSMEVVKRDLSAAYRAVRSGEPPRWPRLPIQFADLAHWEVGAGGRARTRRDLEFWRDRLDPSLPALRLPSYVRGGPPGPAHGSVRANLSAPTVHGVRDLARQANASPFSVLLSAFALVLGTYAGESAFHVGTPIGVREHPDSENLVGFFTNTLVLRCDLDDDGFIDLVRRTHQRVVEALAHPHVPFDTLVHELAPRRDPHRDPFFDVWFNMLSYERDDLTLDGTEVREVRVPVAGALFDLAAYVEEDGDELEIALVFRSDVFPANRIMVLLDHLIETVARVCRTPADPIDTFRPPAVRAGRTGFAARPADALVQRLRRQATERPGREAVEFAGAIITYGELASRVRRTGTDLGRLGAGTGDAVAIAARRTPELIVGMVGALAADAAFAVLDLDHPVRRLADQLGRLRPKVLLTPGTEPLPVELEGVAESGTTVVTSLAGLGALTWPADPAGDDLAPVGQVPLPTAADYVAFTSGTTGTPLGVAAELDAVTAFFDWYAEEFELGELDRFSVLAGLSHDPLLRELLLPLWIGATACVPEQAVLATPESTVRWLAQAKVTVVHLTPLRARLLAAAVTDGLTVPTARLVALGGDAVAPDDYETVRELFPNARVIALYGATETPQGMSVTELTAARPGGVEHPPLGRGSPGAEILVLRANAEVAAVNEIGEIGIRSPHLAIGYLGEPDLTASRFVPDPFGEPGVRLYLTGDLGRYRPDETVEFLGRMDDQLNVDGTRVEPAEVERAAREHPGVAGCVALTHRGRLVLMVQPAVPGPPVDDLAGHLADLLVPAMVPRSIVPVHAIPLGPNGKVDRERLLTRLVHLPEQPGDDPAEPERSLDAVADLWREVLGVADVDVDTPFFAAGGTSIGLLALHNLLRERLGRPLSLSDLFEHQTVRRIAAMLAGRTTRTVPVTAPVGDRRTEVVARARAGRRLARELAEEGRRGVSPDSA